MSSVSSMFARRAAASEASFARDEAKANLLRWNEKHEEEAARQIEKISALRRDAGKIANAAIKRGVEEQIEREQQVLVKMRDKMTRLSRHVELARIAARNADHSVDVLAEISAHSLPLGKPEAHHAAPTMYEYGPNVALPEVSQRQVDEAFAQATDPVTALTPPVAPEMRSASVRLSVLSGAAKPGGGAHPAVQQTMQQMALSPSGMLALQQQAMERRLGRPMRESEALQMRAEAKASAMASASVLVGTACCMVAAAFAAVVVWRQYGKPRSREQLEEAQATVSRQQLERKAHYEAAIGPVVGSIRRTAEAAIPEHEGLKNLAAGLSTNQATRYVPPPAREAELKARADARAKAQADVRAAQETRERAELHSKVAAAEAAWQASGGAVMGLDEPKSMGSSAGGGQVLGMRASES